MEALSTTEINFEGSFSKIRLKKQKRQHRAMQSSKLQSIFHGPSFISERMKVWPDGGRYAYNFTVACASRIKKKKGSTEMSRSVKGLYEKVQSCLSAHSLQRLFKLLPPNSCSGLIP